MSDCEQVLFTTIFTCEHGMGPRLRVKIRELIQLDIGYQRAVGKTAEPAGKQTEFQVETWEGMDSVLRWIWLDEETLTCMQAARGSRREYGDEVQELMHSVMHRI
jgi:hypothetical protein